MKCGLTNLCCQQFKNIYLFYPTPLTTRHINHLCNSIASISLLTPTWARTRDPLHTSTTATLKASLPIAPQKPWPLQSKGNNNFEVSERVTSPIETLLACTPLAS